MTDKQIKAINALFLAAYLFIFEAICTMQYALADQNPNVKGHAKTYQIITQADVEEVEIIQEPKKAPPFNEQARMRKLWDSVIVSYRTIELEYLGRYFITAYCPEECGWSWETSSGATCHYSDNWATPTTCAIDLSVHSYWDTIQVGDPDDPNKKIYMTEDTGPGVRGQWVDCFVETMEEVESWPTRWDSVYRVEYGIEEVKPCERRLRHELISNYLHDRCGGAGFYRGNDPGSND